MVKKLAICILAVGLLVGCEPKEKDEMLKLGKQEVVDKYRDLELEKSMLEVEIEELKELMAGVGIEEKPTAAIETMSDGTGRLTFNRVDGKITFATPFEYPESSQAPNNSSINITDGVTIEASNNWQFKFEGTSLMCTHSSGVAAQFKVGAIKKIYPSESMETEVFPAFFEGFPPDTVGYTKLYLNNNWWGVQAKTSTFVDSKDWQYRCGMVGMSKSSLTYMFMYEGKYDEAKEEISANLLGTVKIFNQQLRVEN